MDAWLARKRPPRGELVEETRKRRRDGTAEPLPEVLPATPSSSSSMPRTWRFRSAAHLLPAAAARLPALAQPEFPESVWGAHAIQQWSGRTVFGAAPITASADIPGLPLFALAGEGPAGGEVRLVDARPVDDAGRPQLAGRTIACADLGGWLGPVSGIAGLSSSSSGGGGGGGGGSAPALACVSRDRLVSVDTGTLQPLSELRSPDDAVFGGPISADRTGGSGGTVCAAATAGGAVLLADFRQRSLVPIGGSAAAGAGACADLVFADARTVCSVHRPSGAVRVFDIRHAARPLVVVRLGSRRAAAATCGCGRFSLAADGRGSVWRLACGGELTRVGAAGGGAGVPDCRLLLRHARATHGLAYVDEGYPQLVCGARNAMFCVTVPSPQSIAGGVDASRAVELRHPHHTDVRTAVRIVRYSETAGTLLSVSRSESWRLWSPGRRRTGRAVRTVMQLPRTDL